MENRKHIKFLIPIFILGFFVANFNSVFAYEIKTHAYLTNEVIKLYNQNFTNNKIDEELIPYLLDGARREDDIPRWMNHFYDPVKNRGLTRDPAIDPLYNLGTWQKSKDWAQDSTNQISALYNPVLNSTLAAFYAVVDPEKLKETDFSWQRAITDYVNGDQKRAFYALGHILHLIEDKSVPDHTRNDPHAQGSPYEIYSRKYNLNNKDNDLSTRLANKKPLILTNLEFYFNELSLYSNNNFYSKDTIGVQGGYENPNSMDRRFDSGLWFRFYKDQEFGEYRLVQEINPGKFNYIVSNQTNFSLIDPDNLVMQDYWSRLSTKSVQYGAGVVNLFFQEVEKAKNDPNFTNTEEKSLLGKAIDSTKSFFAQVSSTVGNFFFGIFGTNQGFQPAGQVSLNDGQSQNSSSILGDQAHNIKIQSQEVQPPKTNNQSAAPINQIQEEADQEIIPEAQENQKLIENQIQKEQIQIQQTQPLLTFKECSFATSQSPSRQKIIINEVAWMGGSSDFGLTSTDEWIELKNISNAEVDVSNWQLIDKAEQIKINLGSLPKTKVAAGGFILLERTNDNSAPNVPADLIYSNTLNNSDEGLRLFDNQCNLIDEVLANPNWPAGDNTQKRTMERSPDLSWHTYNGTAQNNIFGTPKKENSQPTIISSGSGGGGSNVSTNNQQQTTTSTSTSSPEKILISEIQITGGPGKTTNDFIELYNPNNFQINLKGYRLVKRTKTDTNDDGIKSWTSDAYIPAKGYYLWANSGYTDIPATPDITTTATISDHNGVAIRFGAADTGTIIDSVAWGEAQNAFIETAVFPTNPGANQSIQRKFHPSTSSGFIDTNNNADDFEIQTCPSPKAQLKTCQQANQAPSAFFVYAPQNPIVGEIITFSAASSSDPDLDGQIISYQWDFGDNITSAITTATTTHTYSQAGNYSVSLIVFDNQNASSTTTSTVISIASSAPQSSETNHIVISEIYPDKTGNNFDFVELYNPTNSSIPLGDYSLRILKEGATSTTSLANFSSTSTIITKSFFLIGLDNYNSTSTLADVSRSYSLPTTQTATIILYNGNSSIDEFNYNPANIANGQSLERKSFSGGVCVSAQNDSEFLGNGCDTDSATDFEIRNMPNPQNSLNFPEPRSAPISPQNFEIHYSTSTMELNFNWNASQDYNNSTSTLTYKITDISNTSSTLTTIETASTTAKISINEIGRQYNFSIQAFDGNGLNSKPATSTISIQSFLSNLYFYQDPRASSTDYLIEAYYNQYPFAPDLFGQGSNWKILVFYLNSEAEKQNYIYGSIGAPDSYTSWPQEILNKVLKIQFKTCAGGDSSEREMLILPDISERCNTGGGAANSALQFSELEDNRFIIKANSLGVNVLPQQNINFNTNDYLTIAYYSFYGSSRWSGGTDNFQLVATDKTKYYFQNLNLEEVKEFHKPPLINGELNFNYDDCRSILTVSWSGFSDSDTLNNLLRYEISYDNGNTWNSTIGKIADNIFYSELIVEPGNTYNIKIRAIDDFNLISEALSGSFNVPIIIYSDPLRNICEYNPAPNGYLGQILGSGLSGNLKSIIIDIKPTNLRNNPSYIILYESQQDGTARDVAYFTRDFNQNEIGVQNEYIFTTATSYALDSTKHYVIIANINDIAPIHYWGSSDPNIYPNGTAIRNYSYGWQEGLGKIKDLYFRLEFDQ